MVAETVQHGASQGGRRAQHRATPLQLSDCGISRYQIFPVRTAPKGETCLRDKSINSLFHARELSHTITSPIRTPPGLTSAPRGAHALKSLRTSENSWEPSMWIMSAETRFRARICAPVVEGTDNGIT